MLLRCSASYVDNANVVGITAESTQKALEHVKQDFNLKSLDFHEEHSASQETQLLGAIFDGRRRQIRLLPRRTWRLHLAPPLGAYLALAWRLLGAGLAPAWRLPGDNLALTSRLLGASLALTWR